MKKRTKSPDRTTRTGLRKLLGYFGIAVIAGATLAAIVTLSTTGSDPAHAQFRETPHSAPPPDVAARQSSGTGPEAVPGNAGPSVPRADMWRSVRQGIAGRVSIADKKAGVLVQSEGENFRIVQNGPLPTWGGWLMLGMIVLLALFFAVRGRIRIEGGESGHTVQRFNLLERFMHWLTAISFVLLALTGLNILYGRYALKPLMGASAFATMTAWGKYTHDYVAFAFMAGLVLMFVLWVAYNLPTVADVKWLLQGGGLFTKKGSHAPAYKFNAGQKMLFWFLVLGGFSVSFSGFCLLMPFTLHPFAPTFGFLNLFGLHLPTTLTALQETQLALVWHAAVALLMIALILAHIYIGTLGMEGAFRSMTDGKVDENWAAEHHPLWLARLKNETPPGTAGQPAE
jgi:formate dehydrogenase subunit gamma